MAQSIDISISAKSEPIRPIQDIFAGYTSINPISGELRLGQITGINPSGGYVEINVITDKQRDVIAPYPGFMVSSDGNSGLWYGLKKGDLVLCSIAPGKTYYVINKIGNNNTDAQNLDLTGSDTIKQFVSDSSSVNFSELDENGFLLKSGLVSLNVSEKNGAFLGSLGNGSINFDTSSTSQNSSTSLVSNQQYNFTNCGYTIDGLSLRDKRVNVDGATDQLLDPKNIKRWYINLSQTNLDPSLPEAQETKNNYKRNPPIVEKREVVLEFSDDYFIESDNKESKKQNLSTPTTSKSPLTSRRQRKDDTLSLSLISPNYLIEKIEGTVIDFNGNILDINRNILPIGNKNGIVTLDGTEDSFTNIRELHRKGIAYHWELNARKPKEDQTIENGIGENYATTSDTLYKRNRSRFFLDIDKEGQIKLNVPSSSETGNVSVLARYENYSSINPYQQDNNYDYDYFSKSDKSQIDILLDQFGIPVISLTGNDKLIPNDRITNQKVKVGTAYHDISKTCVYPIEDTDRTSADNQFRTGILYGPDYMIEDNIKDTSGNLQSRDILKNTSQYSVVTKELIINGDKANAGGRSGTVVSDGMWNISIGANTIDKQSLWLDLQGGEVKRIGCDKNGISSITQTDGDFYLQVGGEPGYRGIDGTISDIDPDPRFQNDTNIIKPSAGKTNVFEIRVMQGNGQYCRILIDNKGVVIASPKTIEFRADEDILLYAGGSIRMNGEIINIHKDDFISSDVPPHRQSRIYEKVYEQDASGDGFAILKPYMGAQQILG